MVVLAAVAGHSERGNVLFAAVVVVAAAAAAAAAVVSGVHCCRGDSSDVPLL